MKFHQCHKKYFQILEEISNTAKELNFRGDEVTGAASNLKKSINSMEKSKFIQ